MAPKYIDLHDRNEELREGDEASLDGIHWKPTYCAGMTIAEVNGDSPSQIKYRRKQESEHGAP